MAGESGGNMQMPTNRVTSTTLLLAFTQHMMTAQTAWFHVTTLFLLVVSRSGKHVWPFCQQHQHQQKQTRQDPNAAILSILEHRRQIRISRPLWAVKVYYHDDRWPATGMGFFV